MKSPDHLSLAPLVSIASRSPNNLPAPLTSRIDRTHNIASVTALVTRDDVRLLTLAGWLIATPHARYDDIRRGVELFGAVARLTEQTGAPLSAMYRALNEKRTEIARRRLTAPAWDEAW